MDTATPKGLTYRFNSEYAEIAFNVVGFDTWSEERFDDCAYFDLSTYVANPQDFWMDDCWSYEPTDEEIQTLKETADA